MVKPPVQRNATINSSPKDPKEPKIGAASKLAEKEIEAPKPNTSTKTSFTSTVKPVAPAKPDPGPATTVTTSQAATQPPPSQPVQQATKPIPNPVQIQHVPSQLLKIAKWVVLFAGIGYGIASLSAMSEQTKLQETSNKAKKGKSKKDSAADDAEKDAFYTLFGSETND